MAKLNDSTDYFVVDDVIKEMGKENSCKDIFMKYSFLIWDGLGFWGTDVTKLDRLKKGTYFRPPGWFDHFKSFEYFVTSVIFLWVSISIIVYEANRVGTIDKQNNKVTKESSLSYPADT